jgi:hypothetical protein
MWHEKNENQINTHRNLDVARPETSGSIIYRAPARTRTKVKSVCNLIVIILSQGSADAVAKQRSL